MCTPGLSVVRRAIQRANASGSFGRMPAARLRRLPTCVRSGPIDAVRRRAADRCGRRRSRWRGRARARARRAPPAGAAAGAPARRASARTPRARITTTSNAISACDAPQYSAQAPRKMPGARRLEREARDAAGNHVHLAGERRHPERMDDVGALEAELDRLADRQADLVGELDRVAVRRQIAHAPPPLLADDRDLEAARGRRRDGARQHREPVHQQRRRGPRWGPRAADRRPATDRGADRARPLARRDQ